VRLPSFRRIHDSLLRLAGLLTAVAVGIATLGIPLPLPVLKDTSEPFPCMNCGCSCLNAEMCWRECCCFTNTEKLAWAEKHGVKVPGYLFAQAAEEGDPTRAEDLAPLKPCCRARAIAARQASCCSKRPGICETEAPAFVPGVLGIHALKCQGNSLSLSLLPPSVPTDEIGTDLPLNSREAISLLQAHLYQPPFFEAVVPPPEFAAL
jgi:hypothetical protein